MPEETDGQLLYTDDERNYEIRIVPCCITGEFTKCIVTKIGFIEDRETGEQAEVHGQFSEQGLLSLLTDLREAPLPIQLPTSEEIRQANPYGWGVTLTDGRQLGQWSPDGRETPFRTVHLPDVTQFWLLPKPGFESLPRYIFCREKGFHRYVGGTWVDLELPYPENVPFEWHYYRRNSITCSSYVGQTDQLPPHCVQVMGWRIDQQIFEIGVEENGDWAIFKKEPKDDPEWKAPRKILTDQPVRFIDPVKE